MQTREQLDVDAFRAVMTTFRDTVNDHAAGLNRLNVYPVPDGDTGTNMSRTLDAVIAEMDTAAADDMVATCDAVSHGSLMGARGNSGVILSQILRGLASTFKSQHQDGPGEATPGQRFAEALSNAAAAAYQAVLKPMEGTILTVVRESAEAATAASEGDASLVAVLRAAKDEGQASLDRTPELLPVLKDAGVVDAGGAGYLLLLDAALHVVDGEPLPAAPEGDDLDAVERAASVAHRAPEGGGGGELDVSEQRYEVMYFLDLDDAQIDGFKTGWGEIGDSIVVVGGDGIWNCHIHTNDIGAAIEVPLTLGGRPKQIRVTDLFEEVDEEHARREAELTSVGSGAELHVASRAGAGLPPVTTAVVAVATGDGIAELFAQLRVQGFVRGGQTMNPSTAELLDVVEHVNADQVVILPNNKNIIPVAEQVDALTTKSVHVVPTRTLVQALGALIVYDPEADAADNVAEMAEAADSVVSGEVTQAVRDSNTPAGAVSEGDWMGLVDGEGIVALSGTTLGASTALLDHMLREDGELLTVIVGEGAEDDTTKALLEWLAESHAEVQVEVHAGGQPLYPYLFGLE